MTREDIIEKLIEAIKITAPKYDGCREFFCPYCLNKTYMPDMEMIQHDEDCEYRLAKEL